MTGKASKTQNLSLDTGRILIVDDEPMVTMSIAAMLGLESQYEVTSYNAPQEALDNLKDEFPPDVVISDFLMPNMDGITFLQHIRHRFPDTTLILLTGYADKENAIQAINEVGIYRYIEKPWDNETLKMAIRNGVERTRLVNRLNEKISELEQARMDLKEYSEHLEERVTEKTHDLTLALNKLKAVVENTGDAILTMDANGNIQRVNPTFSRWTKRTASFLEGKPVSDFLTFQDNLSFQEILRFEEHSQLREARLGNLSVEVNISPLPGREGAVFVCRDIVKRKEAERLREDFVSTLTHDLRTPLLASIQSITFFLDGTMGEVSPRQCEMLEMMRESNKQMLELVNDLLEVYKYEAKQQRLALCEFQMADLVHQVMMELQPLALSKNQTMETDIVSPLPYAYGDKQAIRRVLMNLVGNAIHYTQAGGHIHVSTAIQDKTLVFSVKDNGRGIPKSDIGQLFERFAQGTSRHRTTGTGLGLYLSRQILEAHGGRIWVESVEGQGSTFSFELLKASDASVAQEIPLEKVFQD